ncbi:MAG: diguanylate cyclase [Pseudomonadota bacterium]
MDKVLLVEDAEFFGSVIEKTLTGELGLAVIWVKTLKDAASAIEEHSDFALALLDLTLPDASRTEIVELVTAHNIPALVFSGTYRRSVRDAILKQGVIDYVIKESPASLNYLFETVKRVLKNRKRTVLVVDDSAAVRRSLTQTLELFQLNVLAAKNGAEALEIFLNRPEIALVITDFDMPELNGLELTKALFREALDRKFSIIGLSSHNDADTRIQFIKSGANDFLSKPFESEELFCRVSLHLNQLDQLELLHEQANNDYLTGLHNRRYFIESGQAKLLEAHSAGQTNAIAMIDIDNFKDVNDRYGHDAGDWVLVGVAERLQALTAQADLVARLGGEEFCNLFIDSGRETLVETAAQLLREIGETAFDAQGVTIPATVSIGIAYGENQEFKELLDRADALLFEAKRSGRNRALVGSASRESAGDVQVVQGPANTGQSNER